MQGPDPVHGPPSPVRALTLCTASLHELRGLRSRAWPPFPFIHLSTPPPTLPLPPFPPRCRVASQYCRESKRAGEWTDVSTRTRSCSACRAQNSASRDPLDPSSIRCLFPQNFSLLSYALMRGVRARKPSCQLPKPQSRCLRGPGWRSWRVLGKMLEAGPLPKASCDPDSAGTELRFAPSPSRALRGLAASVSPVLSSCLLSLQGGEAGGRPCAHRHA